MMFARRNKAQRTPINLATLPGQVVAVQLAGPASVGRPRLLLAESIASSAPASERLDQIARKIRLRRTPLRVLLEVPDYQLLQTEIPAVPAEELKTAMRWQVKDMLRIPLEQTTLDVALPPPIPEGHNQRRLGGFVVAAANSLVLSRMLQFRAYNAEVAVIDVPEMAQRNLADRLAEPGRATAVLSLNQGGCLFTASRDGVLYFTRNFDLSLDSLKGDEAARRDLFDRLLLELQRSLDVLDHQFSFLSVSSLWLAPFAHTDELLSLLIENLYLPVKLVDLAKIFDCSMCPLPTDPDLQAALFHALGLALRAPEEAKA